MRTLIFFSMAVFMNTVSLAQRPNWVNCLSGEVVNDMIIIDEEMWIATSGGVVVSNSLDNKNTYYTTQNSILQSNIIKQIKLDSEGTIWILTDRGLVSVAEEWKLHEVEIDRIALDENNNLIAVHLSTLITWTGDEFVSTELSSNQSWIYATLDLIINKQTGDIWIASSADFSSLAVRQISQGSESFITSSNSALPWTTNGVSFSIDNDGITWMLAEGRIYIFDGEWKDISAQDDRLDAKSYYRITHDELGKTYLVDHESITIIDADMNISQLPYPKELRTLHTPSFIKIVNKDIFLGIRNMGLWKYSDSEWSKINTSENSFRYNHMEVSKDQSEKIYIKTGTSYSFNQERKDNQIYTYTDGILEDESTEYPFYDAISYNLEILGNVPNENWMHVNNTLFQEINGEWEEAILPNAFPDLNLQNSSIYFDHNRDRWLTLKDTSIILYESPLGWLKFGAESHLEKYERFNSIFNHPSTNDLWLTSSNYISTYNYELDTWKNVLCWDLDLSSNNLRTTITKDGNIYGISGSDFFKVIRQDSLEIIIDPKSPLFQYPSMYTIYADGNDIWIGMEGQVVKYADENIEIFNQENSGIPQAAINSIVKDENDNLWFGTSGGGLSIYNPNGVTDDILAKASLTKITEIKHGTYKVYPNPATTEIIIESLTQDNVLNYRLFDAHGRLVKSGISMMGSKQLNIQDIPSGLFYIQVIEPSSFSSSIFKIIKL